ncbi:GTP cyclohydrolase FolE2 [Tropicimonas marinistellae]|uniref:GTP cyclohydrolase FolE2 n=1 Tax=Tropicimonas marinistellae TaxID=1739787 RepID=UPI0008301772
MRLIDALPTTAQGRETAELRAAVVGMMRNEASTAPTLSRQYPQDFSVDASYRSGLPDLQNGPDSLIRGARDQIRHVGISNFRLPVRYRMRCGGDLTLETSVSGTVSLADDRKGINMSRIMRSFYASAERAFSFDVMEDVLRGYRADHQSPAARLAMNFRFPVRVQSLRSGLEGYQYYNTTLEVADQENTHRQVIHLDYVYSSTCPCSLELSEHARATRGQLATPHSQRSVARLSVVVRPGSGILWFEDVVDMCRRAVPTETQVMVKREDEQAFAELNAANPIFVEDAVRLFAEQLAGDDRIADYRVVASHQESLHSHDAVAVIARGPAFEQLPIEPHLFDDLRNLR